jgi:dephospho-CoA kinase
MLKAALTGGIATGKTYVRSRFERLGAVCLDADEIAHGVIAPGTEGADAIAARFGPGVMTADGSVDRAALGRLVFGDEAARRALEAIVHPAVWRSIHVALRALQATENPPVAIVEIPLVYETGHAGDFDRVIATLSPVSVQVRRLVERGFAEGEARQRVESQMPAEAKASLADYVITTDGSFADTDRQVDAVWNELAQDSASVGP